MRRMALILALALAMGCEGDGSTNPPPGTGPTGIIYTVAGNGIAGLVGEGGPALQASLNYPMGIFGDGAGNLYIADRGNQRIRKLDPNGILTTVAGNGNAGFSGDGGPALQASLNNPRGVFVDGTGNLYIIDAGNHRIRKVDTEGIITTVAGSDSSGFGGDGETATRAQLSLPTGAFVDAVGDLFIADRRNHRIRKVDTEGIITTVAGSGNPGFSGDGRQAIKARLNSPMSVWLDGSGNLFIADTGNYRIRKVDTDSIITTVAGDGNPTFAGDGNLAIQASLNVTEGVTVDGMGNFYIVDTANNRIRRVDTQGIITTVAGNGSSGFSGDSGLATKAQLRFPTGIFLDQAGDLFIADTNNHRIRKVELQSN